MCCRLTTKSPSCERWWLREHNTGWSSATTDKPALESGALALIWGPGTSSTSVCSTWDVINLQRRRPEVVASVGFDSTRPLGGCCCVVFAFLFCSLSRARTYTSHNIFCSGIEPRGQPASERERWNQERKWNVCHVVVVVVCLLSREPEMTPLNPVWRGWFLWRSIFFFEFGVSWSTAWGEVWEVTPFYTNLLEIRWSTRTSRFDFLVISKRWNCIKISVFPWSLMKFFLEKLIDAISSH